MESGLDMKDASVTESVRANVELIMAGVLSIAGFVVIVVSRSHESDNFVLGVLGLMLLGYGAINYMDSRVRSANVKLLKRLDALETALAELKKGSPQG